MRKILTIIGLLFSIGYMFSQDLSGEWETAEKNPALNYYGKLILEKTGNNSYTGTSYDDQSMSKGSYTIKGVFDSGESFFKAENEKKINGTKNHLPSMYELTYLRIGAYEYLKGNVRTVIVSKTGAKSYSSPKRIQFKRLAEVDDLGEVPSGSDAAENVFDFEADKIQESKDKTPQKSKPNLDNVFTDKSDLNLESGNDQGIYQVPSQTLTEMKTERKHNSVGSFSVGGVKTINLNIRDYGEEDGDIVTIFHNDKLVVGSLRVSNKGQDYTINLEKNKVNKLIFIANNLGNIPPNTTKIRIDVGNKKYFKQLSVDEQANAVIELVP